MELLEQLQAKSEQLDICIQRLRQSGKEYAEAERDYKILLHQECLKLREQGYAVGMIDKICYGVQNVANARFKRDIAEAYYKANLENINCIKLQLRLLEAQIQREWGVNTSS